MLDKNECTLLSDVVFPGNKQPWNLMVWNSNLLFAHNSVGCLGCSPAGFTWVPATWKSEAALPGDSLVHMSGSCCWLLDGHIRWKFSPSVSVSQAIVHQFSLCSYRGLLFTYLQPHRNISFLPSLLVPIRTLSSKTEAAIKFARN